MIGKWKPIGGSYPPPYPARVYFWIEDPAFGQFAAGYWRSLCVVYDAEALGLLERLLNPTLRLRVESINPNKECDA